MLDQVIKEEYQKLGKQNKILKWILFILIVAFVGFIIMALNVYESEMKENIKLTQENIQLQKTNKMLENDVELLNKYVEALEADSEKSSTIHEQAAEIYDIDPKLLEAIERLESGNYTSELCVNQNNTWGARDGNGWKSFDSREQSTMELARCLRLNYYNQGLTTVEEIAPVYCPDGSNWAGMVNDIYMELTA